MKYFRLLMACSIICISLAANSQSPRGPFIISPQVNEYKTVVFRYLVPYTEDVKLSGSQFIAAQVPMKEKRIHVKPYIVSGGHTWMNCKLYLTASVQEIFR